MHGWASEIRQPRPRSQILEARRNSTLTNLVGAWEMKRILGTTAAVLVATLAVAAVAHGAGEQTRDSYAAQVEPICKANRELNERIMDGARERIADDEFARVGGQFIRLSASVANLADRLEKVPPPPADTRRISRWIHFIRLLKTRTRNVGKYYREGLEIKGTHESILAERSGLSANNLMVVFPIRSCRFGRVG